jgi:hypothetical protein
MSETEPTPHVKVTLQTLYDKQLENQALLVKTLAKLENLADVPERLRTVELRQARAEWVERVAYVALASGVTSVVGLLVGVVNK